MKTQPSLSLLCWNIQKRSLTTQFQYSFELLLKHYPCSLVLLQEAHLLTPHLPPYFQNFSHALCCNFSHFDHCFGVLTLSRFPILSSIPYLSGTKEFGIATRKGAILSRHSLPNGETLSVLNLHAINFVPHKLFVEELKRISLWLERVEEKRLIVAGDFNTWSSKRQKSLIDMMERFGLHRALPKNEKMIKSVLGQPLDHVYYRGLTLTDALVIDTPVSDHNPIFTKFLV